MAEIIVNERMKKAHLDYWKKKICPILEENIISEDINRQYKEILSYLLENWDKIAIGDVGVLRDIHSDIKLKESDIEEVKKYKEFIISLLGYKTFSKNEYGKEDKQNYNSGDNIKKWTAYTLIKLSNVRNCPYCNRQYISPIYASKGKMRPDLDHFLPKSKYPCFSMSLYNLVPVCKNCNSSLKGNHDFGFTSANPFVESFDELFSFDLDITSKLSAPKIDLTDIKENAKSFVDKMQIYEQYKIHLDVADELVRKSQMYPLELLEKLSENEKLVKDKELFKEDLFGYINDEVKRKNTPLGKFKTDLARSLVFF